MRNKRVRIWRCEYPEWILPSVRYYIGFRIRWIWYRIMLPYSLGKWLYDHNILV